MTPLGVGHPFQMADVAEIEVPLDWTDFSAWHSTRISATMPRDAVTGTCSRGRPCTQPGSKERSRWSVRAPTNTREIGNLVMVELRKGLSGGLGFSITTRDNLDGPNSPIYIKHILPDGAAIKDGRLRPGDRLLQVDDVMLTGKCLSDVTAILRNIEVDALTRIAVSRQMAAQNEIKTSPQCHVVTDRDDSSEDIGAKEEEEDALVVSRCSASESSSPISVSHIKCDDRMETLWLRVAQDGSAGSNQLGLRVKRSKRHDLSGLRIRSVIAGGLADKDGQLQANDHLVEVNGISLVDVDKPTAVDLFRSAVQRRNIEKLTAIDITIIRWRTQESLPPPHPPQPPHSKDSEPMMICDETSESLTLNDAVLDESDSDKRMIPFSNLIAEVADVVEVSSVDCMELVDHNVVLSSGKHLCDFLPDHGSVLPQVEEPTPAFRENEVVVGDITESRDHDNSASVASSLQSSDAVVQEKEEVGLTVACFERQGFGRISISEKRSSRELLSDSEVYRSIKENRKRKDQMKPEKEVNVGYHEVTYLNRGEMEFQENFQVLEPAAALGSNPRIAAIPYGTDVQRSLSSAASTTFISNSDGSHTTPGLLPRESYQQGSLPNGSDSSEIPDPRGFTPGSILHISPPLPSVPSESVTLVSTRHGCGPVESFPAGSVQCELSLPQNNSLPPVPRRSHSHRSVSRVSVPHGSIPSGSVPQESVPIGSTPDVLMNACISNDLRPNGSKDASRTAAAVMVNRQNDSLLQSNSSSPSTSSQVASETLSTASPSSAKPAKKFTASLIRKFFKKGFSDLFGSETQTGSRRHAAGEDRGEGVVKHLTPNNNNPIRKDFSLPRAQSARVGNNVISPSHSHPDLQQQQQQQQQQQSINPNAIRTVPPRFYNREPFQYHHPAAMFPVPLSSATNTLPLQFFRPNHPYPFSTVLVRPSQVPSIPPGFALCPTYVPLGRPGAIQVCPVQGHRFQNPPIGAAGQLSWVGFGHRFVNAQHVVASQEPRFTYMQ